MPANYEFDPRGDTRVTPGFFTDRLSTSLPLTPNTRTTPSQVQASVAPAIEALQRYATRGDQQLDQAMLDSLRRLQAAQSAVPAQPAGLEQIQAMFNQGIASQLPYGQMMQNPYGMQTQFNPYGVMAPGAYMSFGAPAQAPEAGGE